MQRPGGHQADDRGTVGVGDQPVVPGDVLGVDLRDDEGHVLVEAEGVAVVHHGGTSAHGLGQELLGNVVAGGAQHDVHAIEGLGLCLDELDLPPAPLDLLACGARARQQAQLAHREVSLGQALEHLRAHRARRAKDRNVFLVCHGPYASSSRNASYTARIVSSKSLLFTPKMMLISCELCVMSRMLMSFLPSS